MHISTHLPAAGQFTHSQREGSVQNPETPIVNQKDDVQLRKVESSSQTDKAFAEQDLKVELTQQIQSLAKRDREVRTHERIHASLAGPYGDSPQFQFQRGPDGVLYAISGSVALDASPIPGNPEATERKARTIQRAALAPSDPSSTDRAVAARAASMGAQAQLEINQNLIENTGSLIDAYA